MLDTTIEILLADIANQPEDDCAWRILGDYLKDRDDPRGEVIHLTWKLLSTHPREHRDDRIKLSILLQKGVEYLLPKWQNTLEMEFCFVPGGSFWPGGSAGRCGNREIEIPYDFWIGKYPVTQLEYWKMTGKSPSNFTYIPVNLGIQTQDHFPVESVSWHDCQEFCLLLNSTQMPALYETTVNLPEWIYCLPTELEWEYACRGAPLTQWESSLDFYVADCTKQYNLSNNVHYNKDSPTVVGSYPPNRLGVHDMHGNVWEWTSTLYKDRVGSPWEADRERPCYVFRGGAYTSIVSSCTASMRSWASAGRCGPDLGMRVIRVRRNTRRV